ncbi:hypothetical protein CDAR_317841 [Caerostris darwini]|uniref:Uncharacterized protein n=1 Tax=Caerostris darwini TaxID=1538125 RepID=A0AAV4WR52_9ARAC|nr:hypothetical protein CDAR_317841 [Caerostris darwini]
MNEYRRGPFQEKVMSLATSKCMLRIINLRENVHQPTPLWSETFWHVQSFFFPLFPNPSGGFEFFFPLHHRVWRQTSSRSSDTKQKILVETNLEAADVVPV